MSTDTGAALVAAIRAAPDDDAPWLVYADWLQEAGRDAEAQAVRAHLPAVRDAVRVGHVVTEVIATAAVHPPGDPVWDMVFGQPPSPPVGFPDALPAWPDPPRWQVERPAERPAEGSGLQYLFVPLLVVGIYTLKAMVGQAERPPEAPVRLTFPDTWKVRTPSPPARKSDPASDRREQSAVAGRTFRQVAGGHEPRTLDFGRDGKVLLGSDRSNIVLVYPWSVGEDGVIEVARPDSGLVARLVMARLLGRVYAAEWNGRPELYVRQR